MLVLNVLNVKEELILKSSELNRNLIENHISHV